MLVKGTFISTSGLQQGIYIIIIFYVIQMRFDLKGWMSNTQNSTKYDAFSS